MDNKSIQRLDGKLSRTCYAIVFEDLIVNIDTLNKKQINKLMEQIYEAILSATDDSMEYMLKHRIIKTKRR